MPPTTWSVLNQRYIQELQIPSSVDGAAHLSAISFLFAEEEEVTLSLHGFQSISGCSHTALKSAKSKPFVSEKRGRGNENGHIQTYWKYTPNVASQLKSKSIGIGLHTFLSPSMCPAFLCLTEDFLKESFEYKMYFCVLQYKEFWKGSCILNLNPNLIRIYLLLTSLWWKHWLLNRKVKADLKNGLKLHQWHYSTLSFYVSFRFLTKNVTEKVLSHKKPCQWYFFPICCEIH